MIFLTQIQFCIVEIIHLLCCKNLLGFEQRAGYTLEELFQLARSSNVQQRTLALTTLGHIIQQVRRVTCLGIYYLKYHQHVHTLLNSFSACQLCIWMCLPVSRPGDEMKK